jgi:hypothetical protein
MKGHIIHPHLREVYTLLYTIICHLYHGKSTLFATLLPQAFRRITSFQLRYRSHPKFFLLDGGGILNNFLVCLYDDPLTCTTPFLGLLILLSNIPPLRAPSKHLKVKFHVWACFLNDHGHPH